MTIEQSRCAWVTNDPLYIAYHDQEWAVPQHDSLALFECLLLEGAQAGLSWYIILKKREAYRRVFANFDPSKMARFTPRRIDRLVQDASIVRHRGKISAFVSNAKAYLGMREAGDDFSAWLWDFVDGAPLQSTRRSMYDVPASTPLSAKMSRELKKRGFRFVGPTTCYAFMQATGMVNDHLATCFRCSELR